MRYCSEEATRTGKRNVNLNKSNTSENIASNKGFMAVQLWRNLFEQ